jgi:hypothetical protein
VRLYEEVPVWMGKFDAQERQAGGKPVPEEIQRMLSVLVASSTASGEIVDIYDAAGLPKPSLSALGPPSSSRRSPPQTRTSRSRRCVPYLRRRRAT